MKNKLLLHSLRKIKNNSKRFISLFFMALLGVGFFTGIKSTSPDMIKSLDKFFDTNNVYDIEVVSNVGLTDQDISSIKEIDSSLNVYGYNYKDCYANVDDIQYTVRLLELNDSINSVYVNKGRLPKNDNEIAVDRKLLRDNDVKIGDYITIDDTNLSNNKFKIVGEVVSPLYFSMDRGTTTIGNGQIKYFIYTKRDVIKESYYTNIYITSSKLKKLTTNSDDYNDKVNELVTKINNIKSSNETRRYNELYGETITYYSSLGIDVDTSIFIIPKWYINIRSDNSSYSDVVDASENIEKLGNVFPLVFYIIAILISLITMMRMVDEDRSENGTLKALGYNTFEILLKYFIFSITATIFGSLIGVIIGCNLIPRIIWNIYQLMFTVPYFVSSISIKYMLIGTIIAVICICGSAIITCIKNLKNVPATLMRPKAPKNGKRVILENINFIWKRLNFSQKITVRNIFRYKSRVLATIIGIAGCTALVLAGFGLKDSIKNIVSYQYENIFKYQRMIVLNSNSDSSSLLDYLNEKEEVDSASDCIIEEDTIKVNKEKLDVTLISGDFNKLDKLINIIDTDSLEVITNFTGVSISEKISTKYNISVGDYITIYDSNNKSHKVKVSHIIQNYISNYIYLDNDTYKEIFNDYSTNMVLLRYKDSDNNFDKEILERDDVTSLINISETIKTFNKMLGSLDSVVLVLIVAAALLAFIVLYNLSNINISERKREIATLKVLGFYNNEVDNYITKENIILTCIGIILGLIFGTYLSHYIISTCEPDSLLFVRHVTLFSYIISSVITVIFTIIVNIITHYSLLKIDMIESLKNVE